MTLLYLNVLYLYVVMMLMQMLLLVHLLNCLIVLELPLDCPERFPVNLEIVAYVKRLFGLLIGYLPAQLRTISSGARPAFSLSTRSCTASKPPQSCLPTVLTSQSLVMATRWRSAPRFYICEASLRLGRHNSASLLASS